jgi:GNAT superfamily N-acetyltransferase
VPQVPQIRRARPGDAEGIGRVHVAAWRETYPGVLPAAYLAGMSAAAHARSWGSVLSRPGQAQGVFVAEDAKRGVIGYASCGRRRSRIPEVEGEFHALYVDPDAQERGVGRLLMAAMAGDLLITRRMTSACVWVLKDNPSRWFYQHLGGALAAEAPIRFAGATVRQLAYVWQDRAALLKLSTALGGATGRDG